MRFLAYARYVFIHKWYVFWACLKLGVPIWLAIFHDASKFLPREFIPYAYQFYDSKGAPKDVRDSSGAYDPNSQSDSFKKAWISHQKNCHHWQAWVSIGNFGTLEPSPFPERYVREMVADWIGAGKARGQSDPSGWFEKNRSSMVIHPETEKRIDEILEGLGE